GVEHRLERRGPELLDARLVHARLEVIADLLLHGIAIRLRLAGFLQDAPEEARVLVAELSVHAPRRLVRRDWIVLDPSAADVLIEDVARVRRAIHRSAVD